jgi:RNA polymerase sigma-70 factor (ECF subfamily)
VIPDLETARAGDHQAFARVIEPYRRELRAHCYRMAGSLHDADDLMQESLLRAWRGLPGFEGRASLRTWLYRVTTTTCLDQLDKRGARLLPTELGPAARPDAVGAAGPGPGDDSFLEPCPPELYAGTESPEARYAQRESVALAFLVALQRLTPKQRAALILRDVVGLEASECAELLDLSVAAVNSALQRAREAVVVQPSQPPARDPQRDVILARYVEAWERTDVGALVALLCEDATLAMPPIREWLAGASAIGGAIDVMVFRPAGPGTFQLVPIEANGLPGFAVYAGGQAMALHLLELREGRIAAITAFIDPSLFPRFGLAGAL